jgi:uncharacterized membrane protein
MKKTLIAGFIALLPLMITCIIVIYLFDLFTSPFVDLIKNALLSYEKSAGLTLVKSATLIMLISRIIALVLLFFLILLLGWGARKFFFKFLLRLTDKIFLRIPIVKSIYRLSNQVTKATFSMDKKTFERTVLVAFPHEEAHTLAFVTGSVPDKIKKVLNSADLTVFVPTSPHPISGYLLLLSKKRVLETDITTEEAFKFLLSCGVVHPGQAENQNSPLQD